MANLQAKIKYTPRVLRCTPYTSSSSIYIQKPFKNCPISLGIDSTPTIWVPNESLGQTFSCTLFCDNTRVHAIAEGHCFALKSNFKCTCVQLCPKLCPSCDLCGELVEMMHVCAGKKGPPSSPQNQNHQAHPDWNNPHPRLSISKYGH